MPCSQVVVTAWIVANAVLVVQFVNDARNSPVKIADIKRRINGAGGNLGKLVQKSVRALVVFFAKTASSRRLESLRG